MSDELTKEQKQAVKVTNRPLIIIAGPGSGKTRVLTHKAVYLINEKGIKPSEIVMTTFTVKASEEMRTRIANMVKEDISNMFIGTVHSLCDNIIKQYGKEKYVDYEVLDEFKRYIFVKKHKDELGINPDIVDLLKGFSEDWLSVVLRFYDVLAENYIICERLEKAKEKIKEKLKTKAHARSKKKGKEYTEEEIEEAIVNLMESYEKYNELLEKHKLMDFSRLEIDAYEILQDKNVQKELKKRIKYVMVDEFQDINPIQWNIIKLLINKNNITIVGDKNQSIYAFRGANPNIFDVAEKELKNPKKIYLRKNFRSKRDIVELSNRFLDEIGRREMTLEPVREERCKLWLMRSETEYEEARRILDFVVELKNRGKIRSYGEVAIIAKSVRYHLRNVLKLLDEEYDHIPYTVYAGASTFLNPEIRSILFFIAYVLGLEDDEVVAYFPLKKKNGEEIPALNTMQKILASYMFGEDSEPEDVNWHVFDDPKRLAKKAGLKVENAKIVVELNKLRDEIQEKLDKTSILELMYRIVGKIGITSKDDENAKRWLKSIGKLSKLMVQYADIYGKLTPKKYIRFLRTLRSLPESLNIDRDNEGIEIIDNESLVISTVHQVKGLEFPVVIIPSLVSRRFPSNSTENHLIPEDLYWYTPYPKEKEQENLFFVATTRAQDELILSTFERTEKNRTKQSKFLDYVEDMLYEFDDESIDEMEIEDRSKNENKNLVVNYSAISTFVDCPERFKYNYLYGMRAEAIFQQKVGTIYHNAIAKINQYIKDGEEIDDQTIDEILEESWVDLGEKNDTFKPKIRRSLRRYVKFARDYIKKVIAIERSVNRILGGITIKGKADLILENKDGEIVLMDFKSRKAASIKETHVDLQLMLYDMSLELDGMHIDKLIAFPIEEEKVDLKKVTIKKSKKRVNEVLKQFRKCVKGGEFPKTRQSKFCKDCPYKHLCRYMNKAGG